MPAKKGKGCVADVMKEWKAGSLHSGKGGPVVRDKDQAIAIALSMCGGGKSRAKSYEEYAQNIVKSLRDEKGFKESADYGCNCGPECGCMNCRRKAMAIGYPTPTFSENETLEMVMNRLKVIHGRTRDIELAISQAMMMAEESGGEIEMEQWMIDKITLAADYLSAVADNAMYGDGVEVEMEDEDEMEGYAEAKKSLPREYKKGLTKEEQEIAKREIKETMAKAKKPGTSAKELYQDWESDKKYKARKKEKGQSMPKSKATEAYERMYGKKDSSDMSEGSDAALKEKAKESGISYGILKQVFERGMAAWRSGHRPGVAPQQWAMGRVNSFITGAGKARKADDDLWKKAKK